jgi:hypothetical protein
MTGAGLAARRYDGYKFMGYAQIIVKLPLWMRHAIMEEAIRRGEKIVENIKLSELEPRFASDREGRRWFTLDCPKCRDHKIAVQIAGEGKFVWQVTGSVEGGDFTLSPSVAFAPKTEEGLATICSQECMFHFFVRNGEIINL